MTKLVVLTILILLSSLPLRAAGANNAYARNLNSKMLIPVQNVSDDPFVKLKKSSNNQKKFLVAQNQVAMNENNFESSVNSTVGKIESADSTKNKSYFITLQTGYSTNLYDKQDGSREKSWDFLVSPSYKMSENYNFGALLTGSTDVNQRDGSDFSAGQISVSRKSWELISTTNILKIWNFTPSIAIGLPVSKTLRDDTSFLYSIRPTIAISPSAELLGSQKWSTSLSLSFSRNFHSFEQSKSGNPNAMYSSKQVLSLGYQLPKDFQFEISGSHYNSWTYSGVASESYSHNQELSYNITKAWSLAGGHTFGSPSVNIFGPDGQTYNFSLVNEKYSYVYATTTYTY